MQAVAADRGGPIGRDVPAAANWMRAAPPGIASWRRPAESFPIGGEAQAPDHDAVAESRRARHLGLALLLVIASVACFGNALYIHAKAELAQVLLHYAWARTPASGEPVKPWPWADTYPVARLIAPAQHADVLVLAGASGRSLAFGPGHLDGSAPPGADGNSVIVAHRDTHFRFLNRLAAGDALVVEGSDGAYRAYRVRRTYVADYRTLRIPADAQAPTLTLVTCYPFDAVNPGGPLRYVVVAEAA